VNDPLGAAGGRPPGDAGMCVPESLVEATVRAVVRLARREAPACRILSRRTTWLVREAMKALTQNGRRQPRPPGGRSL
jgi:hypothetical protein